MMLDSRFCSHRLLTLEYFLVSRARCKTSRDRFRTTLALLPTQKGQSTTRCECSDGRRVTERSVIEPAPAVCSFRSFLNAVRDVCAGGRCQQRAWHRSKHPGERVQLRWRSRQRVRPGLDLGHGKWRARGRERKSVGRECAVNP